MRRREQGTVLIVSLWMLVVLACFALGLTRQVNADMRRTQTKIGQLQARYAAWGGLRYSLAKIREDSKNIETRSFDDLVRCGVSFEDDETPEKIFKHIKMSDGYFSIGEYGLTDEDRKINLNAITFQNYHILRELLDIVGLNETQALKIASAIVDWHDADDQLTPSVNGQEAENCYPVKCKNRPFDHLEELLLIKDVTPEIFAKLQDLVTVYPKGSGRFQVNFFTAPEEVLTAIAVTFAGPLTNTTAEDARSLVKKFVHYRKGLEPEDYKDVTMPGLALNAKERSIWMAMTQYQARSSGLFRIRSTGVGTKYSVSSTIDAVVERNSFKIVAWAIK